MNIVDAMLIGIFQAVAIIPGVSRSGATISGALSRRLDRDFAAHFSFLLSIPAILGALVLQLKGLIKAGKTSVALSSVEASTALTSIGPLPLAIGALSASLVAFFSVCLALKIVREHTLRGFALYTGIIGLLVLTDKYFTRLFFLLSLPALN
jgi:undecaprenyl-diphosphatase